MDSFENFLLGLWGENGPPVEVADRITASFPLALSVRMNQLAMKRLKEFDQLGCRPLVNDYVSS